MDETMRELNPEELDEISRDIPEDDEEITLQELLHDDAEEDFREDPELESVLSQDTIRLDDLQEVLSMTSSLEEIGEAGPEDALLDETMRLDDITQAAMLEELLAEHSETERETVDLEAEEYDEEGFVNVPLIFKPRQRLRELKRKLIAGPEKRYYELAEQGVGKLQLAMLVCLLVVGGCAASAVFYGMGMVPTGRMKLMIFGQVLAMLLGALMGCQQMIDGFCDLFKGRFTLNTMLLVTFLACCADSVLCLEQLRVPVCGAFALEVFMALWAAYHKRTTEMGQMDTMRKAVRLDSLVKRDDYYDGKPAFLRGEGQVEDFTDYYDEVPGPEKTQNGFALISLVAAIAVAVLGGLRHGLFYGVQIFSTTLLVAVPASFFISISRPMAILERRLHRLGTVLCGWRGIRGLRGKAGFPMSDADLFPNGAAKMNGVKFYGDREPETVIAYAAALMRVNGGGLAPVFEQLLINHNGIIYDAENVRFYGNGGIGGEVCGEPVLLGTLAFLKDMGVEIPDGVMVKQAVYVSVDGELSGLFAVSYARTRLTARGLATVCNYRKLTPLVMSEDFMLTPAFLKERFGIRTRRAVFPDREQRRELQEKQAGENEPALALMTQEGLAPAAFAITGARALRTAWRLGLVIHMIGGIMGLLIMAALAILGRADLLTPMNILIYQLIWMVPGVMVTFLTRTI